MNIIEQTIQKHSVVLFDGVCNLCNTAIQTIIKHDKNDTYRFSSLQSDVAKDFLLQNPKIKNLDSILLITSKKTYTLSSAVLQISKKLKGLYPLLFIFYYIPKPIRDGIYKFIAKNRYKWFGKKESCMIPSSKLKAKFL